MKTAARLDQLMRSAAQLVENGDCYLVITREQIANTAGCAPALINFHYETMGRFRDDLMRWAVKHRHLPIIAQGLAHGCKIARRAPWNVLADAREII